MMHANICYITQIPEISETVSNLADSRSPISIYRNIFYTVFVINDFCIPTMTMTMTSKFHCCAWMRWHKADPYRTIPQTLAKATYIVEMPLTMTENPERRV